MSLNKCQCNSLSAQTNRNSPRRNYQHIVLYFYSLSISPSLLLCLVFFLSSPFFFHLPNHLRLPHSTGNSTKQYILHFSLASFSSLFFTPFSPIFRLPFDAPRRKPTADFHLEPRNLCYPVYVVSHVDVDARDPRLAAPDSPGDDAG